MTDNKGDLISREALKEKLNKKALDLANGGMIFIESINHIIDNAPTEPQVTVFAENASKEEIEDFKQELENVLARPQGEFTLKELRRWLIAHGYSEGTVEDKIEDFGKFVKRIREDEG